MEVQLTAVETSLIFIHPADPVSCHQYLTFKLVVGIVPTGASKT